MADRRRNTFRRQLHRKLPDFRRAVHVPAQMQFVMRRRMLAEPLTNSVQADRRNMVLCARVMTAADFDADVAQIFRHLAGRKDLRERSGHPL